MTPWQRKRTSQGRIKYFQQHPQRKQAIRLKNLGKKRQPHTQETKRKMRERRLGKKKKPRSKQDEMKRIISTLGRSKKRIIQNDTLNLNGQNGKVAIKSHYKGEYITLINWPGAWKKRVKQHHFIVVNYIGRMLKLKEIVHHIDGIRDNNKIENLYVFSSNGEHVSFEYKIRKYPELRFSIKSNLEELKNEVRS